MDEFKKTIDKEGMIPDYKFQKIFEEIDDDGSGEISKDEFKDMMRKIFEPGMSDD